ncbi:MAG: hypothetical protein H7Y16_02390 [Candidatus Parcubacteria bacterium]|nr:hypothetical protein [Burkholderiales bacterium]
MNICVLVPHADTASQAGVRIRYHRIDRALREAGHSLHILPIQEMAGKNLPAHDAYIISKCHDARALLVAHRLAGSGKPVGVDLFDDYFSQVRDSRHAGMRYWLTALLESLSFVLCSTPAMRELSTRLAPGLPVHVMNDPAPAFDPAQIRATLKRKLERALESRLLRVGWFGIGDNPQFPVGLTDLAALGGELTRLRGQGFDVRLDVLTNLRSMSADGLAMLGRLAIPYAIEEWTEERERNLLGTSLACFLPVNAQNFSVAKSLNRAVSALCSGSQVLSSGYPLYEPLAPFIYRNGRQLLDDLIRGAPLLREQTVPALSRLLGDLASPAREAQSLVAFLDRHRGNAVTAKIVTSPSAAVIYGKSTAGNVHKFAQAIGALSVCSPFCAANLNFDIQITAAADGNSLDVLVAEQHVPSLARWIQGLRSSRAKLLGKSFLKLNLSEVLPDLQPWGSALTRMDSLMSSTAAYPRVMADVETTVRQLFPGIRCYYSESAPFPWHVHAAAAVPARLEA